MAFVIWVLGLIDVLLTKYGLSLGAISEGNPIMASLFSISANTAIAFSLIISAIFLFCLHSLRLHTPLAQKALWGLFVIRVVVIILHVNWCVCFFLT